jgi:hypothetical protein
VAPVFDKRAGTSATEYENRISAKLPIDESSNLLSRGFYKDYKTICDIYLKSELLEMFVKLI